MKRASRILLIHSLAFSTVVPLTPVSAQHLLTKENKSKWVYLNPAGRLVYAATDRGDRIMDFSYAGYMGGGVDIPSPPVKIRLVPHPGDNTAAIQRALDSLSAMPLVNGFRGAVLLLPGVYDCESMLVIRSSGVVLRGSKENRGKTILRMTGRPHTCISVTGHPQVQAVGMPARVSDPYIPSGTMAFHVNNANGLSPGDTIRISRPVTPAWVHFMGMDRLVRDNKAQTWIKGDITIDRVIKKIEGSEITINVPLSDSYDARYLNPPGASVVKIATQHILSNIGIENLDIVSPAQSVSISQRHNKAFVMQGITDGWARNMTIYNTVNSISITGSRITVDKVDIVHTASTIGAAKPADINGSGHQLLFNRCRITGSNLFFFATGAKVSGPIVLLNCVFDDSGWVQPHQRWATGLLIDNCRVPNGGIDFMNRGEYGSGHGWAVGWAVAWNCSAETLLNQKPPGAMNWMIGCSGQKTRKAMPFDKSPLLPDGAYDAYGGRVTPSSLYLAQLRERLGDRALKNIGY